MFHSTNVPSTKEHSTKVSSTKVSYPICSENPPESLTATPRSLRHFTSDYFNIYTLIHIILKYTYVYTIPKKAFQSV